MFLINRENGIKGCLKMNYFGFTISIPFERTAFSERTGGDIENGIALDPSTVAMKVYKNTDQDLLNGDDVTKEINKEVFGIENDDSIEPTEENLFMVMGFLKKLNGLMEKFN